MKYRYDRKLDRDEIQVVLDDLTNARGEELVDGLKSYAKKYGFTFTNKPICSEQHTDSFVLRHLILNAYWAHWPLIKARLEYLLAKFTSVSVSLSFEDDDEFVSSKHEIDGCKRKFGDRINYLMPVRNSAGAWCVPLQKMMDNAVCDTVRVKYLPVLADVEPPRLSGAEEKYFADVCGLFGEHGLFFRSPTDGYIAIRSSQESGFFITCTKTSKLSFDPRRVAFIHDYDEATNAISFSGSFLPSSDAVEAAVMLKKCPSINTIVHTHASALFTRNPRYRHKVLIPQMPYGTPELGRMMGEAIGQGNNDWLIMDDHGEIFFAESAYKVVSVLTKTIQSERENA